MLLQGKPAEMSETHNKTNGSWWRTPLSQWIAHLQQREDQVFLVLTLVIGALTGMAGEPTQKRA